MSHLPLWKRIPSSVEPALAVLLIVLTAATASAQAAGSSPDLEAHIRNLSSLDFPTRMSAAQVIRRVPADEAVAALREAVLRHPDEYVRYRAFVLLSAFNDRVTSELVPGLLGDRNDRLREAAYKWLEARPDPGLTTTLLKGLQNELAEFVRPALVGALAAVGDNPQVQKALVAETTRGVDFFRSAVIDALGRHDAAYAVEAIAGVAKLDGPLQDDALLALGRIGGTRARAVLAAFADGSPPPRLMPTVHAARCLVGEPCEPSIKALVDTASGPAAVSTLRAAVSGLVAIAADGNRAATDALVGLADRGGAVREEAALGFATVAVRNPDHLLAWLAAVPENARSSIITLLKDGFDDLVEDFGEEQFFAATRASYWSADEGSAGRTLAATLIDRLQF